MKSRALGQSVHACSDDESRFLLLFHDLPRLTMHTTHSPHLTIPAPTLSMHDCLRWFDDYQTFKLPDCKDPPGVLVGITASRLGTGTGLMV